MTDLPALLARVEAAVGPNTMLDVDLCVFLHQYSEQGYERFGRHFPVGYYVAEQGIAPAYTASLDAALALVERVQPDWWPGFQKNRHTNDWSAWLEKAGRPADEGIEVTAPTAPLALLAALLRSLSTEEPPQVAGLGPHSESLPDDQTQSKTQGGEP